MSHSVIGRKLGMTQVWDAEGNRVPITVVEVGPCTVTAVKSADGKDGYDAVQIAYHEVKDRKVTKPMAGVYKKAGIKPHRHLREFRIKPGEGGKWSVGYAYTTEGLSTGLFVDVTGTSKGRGFTGVMKRYGYHGSDRGHGTHEAFRNVGTGGQGSATPARVPKGKRRPGQHGNARSTLQNVLIVNVDEPNNLVYLQGGIPGPNGGIVEIKEAKKTPDA